MKNNYVSKINDERAKEISYVNFNRSYRNKEIKYAKVPHHPMFKGLNGMEILLSIDGREVIDMTSTREVIFQHDVCHKGLNYKTVYIRGRDYQVHVLMAAAWLGVPNWSEFGDLLVNHKDGNKQNNHIDNLEWSDHYFNHTHAYQSGLRPDNVAVEVWDIKEDKKYIFYSLQDAARFLDTNAGSLNWVMEDPRRVYKFKYAIRRVNEEYLVDEEDIKDIRNNYYSGKFNSFTPISILNTKTDEIHRSISIEDAAKFLNTYPVKLSRMFEKGIEDYGDYKVSKLTNLNAVIETFKLAPKRTHTPLPQKPVPITVRNTITGEVIDYNSVEEFATLIGVRKDTMQKRIYLNKTGELSGMWNEFEVTYKYKRVKK